VASARARWGRALGAFAAWVALFALYLVLISPISDWELLLGAATAALATAGGLALVGAAEPRWGALGRLPRALAAWPATLAQDVWLLLRRTVTGVRDQAPGTLRLDPAAGPAWAGALLSSTPSLCVLDVVPDPRQSDQPAVLRVHELDRTSSKLSQTVTGRATR
jgi:hypothetical protein